MNKRVFPISLMIIAMLSGCQNSQSSSSEVANELNSYEQSLIFESATSALASLSSISLTLTDSFDDSKLYGNAENGLSRQTTRSVNETISFYSNNVILDEIDSSESDTLAGETTNNSYTKKAMVALLANSSSADSFGLYEKIYVKNASSKDYGSTYLCLNDAFCTSSNKTVCWNRYLADKYSPFTTAFSCYENSDGIKAIQTITSSSTQANPIFPSDTTKAVTSTSVDTKTCVISSTDDSYCVSSSLETTKEIYCADYFGDALSDGVISSTTTTATYSYGSIYYNGETFSSSDYDSYKSKTPVLLTFTKNGSVYSQTGSGSNFSDISSSYQETYGGNTLAYLLSGFLKSDGETVYAISTPEKLAENTSAAFDPDSFTLGDGVSLNKVNDTMYFYPTTNGTYNLSVKYNGTTTAISIAQC